MDSENHAHNKSSRATVVEDEQAGAPTVNVEPDAPAAVPDTTRAPVARETAPREPVASGSGIRPVAIPREPRAVAPRSEEEAFATKRVEATSAVDEDNRTSDAAHSETREPQTVMAPASEMDAPAKGPVESPAATEADDAAHDAKEEEPVKGPVEAAEPPSEPAPVQVQPAAQATPGATRSADEVLKRIQAIKRSNQGLVKIETRREDGEKDKPTGSDN